MSEAPAEPKTAPKGMKLAYKLLIGLAILVVLGLGGWLIFKNVHHNKPANSSTTSSTSNSSSSTSSGSTASKNLAPANTSSATNCTGVSTDAIVPIVYQTNGPIPPCQKVKASQQLEIINPTAQSISVSFGGNQFSVGAHKSYGLTKSFGSYLATGVHNVTFTPSGSAQIWLQ